MRVIRLLALRRLRLQPLRSLLAAVVVGGGTSLMVTILVVLSSVTSSVNDAASALAGPAPLRVLGPQQRGGIDEDALARLRATEGVAEGVPLIQSITMVDPGPGRDDLPVTILGFDCSVTEIIGSFEDECDDDSLAQVTTPLIGARLADELEGGAAVRTHQGRLGLEDAVPVEGLDRINAGRVVALPMPLALAQLGRDGRFDVAYVLPEEGVAVADLQQRLEERLAEDFRVLDALDPPPVVGVVFDAFVPLFTVLALLTLGIGGVLVRNSVTLSLEERRRQTAIVGALGGSRRLLVGGTIVEVVLLGTVGGLLGVVAGVGLAGPVSAGLDEILREIAGVPLEVEVPVSAVVSGILLGVGVALVTAIGPARRAVRIDVAGELASRGRREEGLAATSWRRAAPAFAVMALGVVLTRISSYEAGIDPARAQLAPIGFLISAVGSVAFVAVVVPVVLAWAEGHLTFRRATVRLALSNLRREPRRSAVMAIAIGFAMGVGFITASFKASVAEAITDSLSSNFAGIQVSAIDPNNSATNEARLGPEQLEELAALRGVASVERTVSVVLGNEASDLVGVVGYTDVWEDAVPVAAGRFAPEDLDAGSVVLGPALARARELRPGDEITLSTPEGPVDLPISGVLYDGNFGGKNVQMSYDLLVELYGETAPVQVVLEPEPGVTEADLFAAVEAADLDPDLLVEGYDEVLERNLEEITSQLSTFDAIQRGLTAMSFVAVLSTLLLVGVQRQKEFGMLGAVGMTPAELRRMVLVEAATIAVLAVLVTGVGSIVIYWALNEITPVIIGYKDPFVLDGSAYLRYSVVAVAIAVVAAAYPSRRAAKVEVLEALRYE